MASKVQAHVTNERTHVQCIPQPSIQGKQNTDPNLAQLALTRSQHLTIPGLRGLSRLAGNQAVGRLMVKRGIQPNLTVGEADDAYELEADRVAQQVVSKPAAAPIQRLDEEEDEQPVQTKPLAATITPLVRRQEAQDGEIQSEPISSGGAYAPGVEFESHLVAQQGRGQPLPGITRAFMENQFGTDFSGVRLHTGSVAAQLNRTARAQAFTHGQDIYIGEGKSNLGSSEGQKLIAHELTHVVQQTGMQQKMETHQAAPENRLQRTLDGPELAKNTQVVRYSPDGDQFWTVLGYNGDNYRLGHAGASSWYSKTDPNFGRSVDDWPSRENWEYTQLWRFVNERARDPEEPYYWIKYIGTEIKAAERDRYLRQIFVVRRDAGGRPVVDFQEPLGTNGDNQKRGILQEMFELGFTAYQREDKKTASELSPGTRIAGTSYAMMFRADSRGPEQLNLLTSDKRADYHAAAFRTAPEGFTSKAESSDAGFRTSRGFDKPWNPFNRSHYKRDFRWIKKLWPEQILTSEDTKGVEADTGYFRNESKDNDLMAVVSISVGSNWRKFLHFPIVQMPSGTPPAPYQDITYLYIFLLQAGFDTKAKQIETRGEDPGDEFSEAGVMSIPGEDILAVIPITRKFSKQPENVVESNTFEFEIGAPIRQPWAKKKWGDGGAVMDQLETILAEIIGCRETIHTPEGLQ